jgi:peptidoglycan endopeptidase LytE
LKFFIGFVYIRTLMLKIYKKMNVLSLLSGLLFLIMISSPAWSDVKHTIKKGDSLYKISKKYKIGIEEIRKANNLKTRKLTPGTELTIPSAAHPDTASPEAAAENTPVKKEDVSSATNTAQPHVKTGPKTYKVKKGDSLWNIARKNSLGVAEIKKLNNRKSSKLKPGQVLILGQEPVETEKETVIPELPQTESASKFAKELSEISMSDEADYSGTKEFLISIAQRTLGIPYKFGSNSFKATDCSGYVQMVFNLIGLDLPRSAREQFKLGQSVDRQDLSIGDLVFFQTYAPFPSHVGIYLGNNLFIHASSFAKKVTINSLNAYYLKRFVGAKRLEVLKDQDSLIPLEN